MNRNAAYRKPVNSRSLLASIAALLSMAMLLAGLGGTASAAPLGKNGKIYACYKVKGKPKGALRVVPSSKARCRRGERKVAWSVVAPSGHAGADGQAASNGQSGSGGQPGADGSGSNEATLKTEIAALSLKLEGLEDTLQGVSNGDLTGALGTVKGLSNTQLTNAVGSLPAVEALCEQNEDLTEQVNTLQGVIGGLSLSPALEALGLLEIPALPTELEPFGCPTA